MLTILKSNLSGGKLVRTDIVDRAKQKCGLDWQRVLPKITTALALCAPLFGASLAEAAATSYTIPVTIQAENYSAASGTRSYQTIDTGGGLYVGAISTGDWINYLEHKVVIPVSGQYTISYRVSSPYAGSTFLFNNIGGSISKADRVTVPKTGGWEKWVTVQRTITLKAGPHTFGIKSVLGGFNINWFSITNASGAGTSSSASSVASSKSSVASSLAVSSAVSSIAPVQSSAPSSSKAVSVSSAPAVVSSSAAVSSKAASIPASSSSISSLASSSKVSSSAVSSSSSSKVSSSQVSSSKSSSSSSSKASSSVASGYTQVAGPVGLTWIAPKLREDKSALDITELGGYQLRYKSSTDSKYVYITIKDPWATSYNFDWLEGDYIFEIAAFDNAGVLSDFSNFTD